MPENPQIPQNDGKTPITQDPMQSLDTIIKGVLEGETRLESAKLSIEEIFNNRQRFK
jgi:hypothetical protein